MVNPKKPNNNLPTIPPDFNCDDIEILKLVNKANLALSKLDGQTSTHLMNFSNAMLLAETFTVREAVDSSAVENVATTVKEALESRALPESVMSPAEKETNRYVEATFQGYRIQDKKGFLSTNDIIAIQRLLDVSETGIRKLPGYVIANERTGEVYYTPPEGESLIRDLMKNLEDYFHDKGEDPDPLIKMSIVHYQFEAIHPFPDGNGRTGRILMTLYLTGHGRLRFPVLFLSDYILNNRKEYYERLRAVTYKNDWRGWIEFILKAVVTQANKTTEALTKINAVRDRYENNIPNSIPYHRRTDLLDFLFTTAAFSREQMAKGLDIHINTASAYIKALVSAKLLKIVKRKRTRGTKVYYVPEFIRVLAR